MSEELLSIPKIQKGQCINIDLGEDFYIVLKDPTTFEEVLKKKVSISMNGSLGCTFNEKESQLISDKECIAYLQEGEFEPWEFSFSGQLTRR